MGTVVWKKTIMYLNTSQGSTMTEIVKDIRRNIRDCIDTDREKAKVLLKMLADELESDMKWTFAPLNVLWLASARESIENDNVIGAAYLLNVLSVEEYNQRIVWS